MVRSSKLGNVARGVAVALSLGLAGCFPFKDKDSGGSKAPEPTFTLRGSLLAEQHAVVDSDVNDPLAPYVSNDSPQRAQVLPNPFTLGGYVNLPQHGPNGDSWFVGDVIDVYQADLRVGQTLTLKLSEDPTVVDLDLLLLDAGMNIIDGALGTAATESLTITEVHLEQPVYVAVALCGSTLHTCDELPSGYAGASTYTLSLGDDATPTMQSLRLSDEFIAGDVIATYSPATAPGTARRGVPSSTPTLIKIPRQTISGVQPSRLVARAARGSVDTSQFKLDTVMAVKAMRRRADVAGADLNYIRRAQFIPNDSAYRYQWHYETINLPAAWDVTRAATARDVFVAVIDTGVLVNHPDLAEHVVPGYDFITDVANAMDGDGMDPDGNDPGDRAWGSRSTFHGTHVAGTIAAATDNAIGGAGISTHARIMPLRVLGKNGGSSYDVMQAVLYAAGLKNDSGRLPARRADIINLSLGGGGYSQSEQDAFTKARNAGVIIVAAAGNNGTGTVSYPAAYNGVIAVSAVDSKLARAGYSNYGPLVDVAAPGGSTQWDVNKDGSFDGVYSTSGNDYSGTIEFTYSNQTGTSMATPHVAGVAALMKALKPDLSPADFDALLADGALTQDLGTKGRDNDFGYGMIDAYKAVVAATDGTVPDDPFLVAFPGALNFGAMLTRTTLTVSNGGGGTLKINSATGNANWLRVDAQVDENGLGSYIVSVDRRGLRFGTYSASITLVSDADTLIVPVYIEVDSSSLAGDSVRYQWVVLVDSATGATVATTRADVGVNGYEFEFGNIPRGDYYVYAGTDLDNDSFICDRGEACGAYGGDGEITRVAIEDANIEGVELSCGYGHDDAMLAARSVPIRGVSRMVSP